MKKDRGIRYRDTIRRSVKPGDVIVAGDPRYFRPAEVEAPAGRPVQSA